MLLRLSSVSLTFQRGRAHYVRVLDGVSLELDAGQVLAVLAQPCAGKTTLLRVAAGLDRPDRGEVLIHGRNLWRENDRFRARLLMREIALLDHKRPDLDLTARELVALPLLRDHGRRGAYARATRALERVGLADCVAQRWDGLSDSERARLTLARGVVRQPRLVLLDDLLVPLSLVANDEIGRLVRALSEEQGFGAIISVADAESTVWCHRIASFAGGKLLEAPGEGQPTDGNVIDFPVEPARRALP